MEPTRALALINSLCFLANPDRTDKNTVKTINASEAQFVRLGKEGKLGVAYPFTFYSYQQSQKLVLWETVVLDGFCASTEEGWSSKYDTATKITTLLRHPFLFQRKIRDHKGQITVQPAGDTTYIKKIEQLVLERGLLNQSCGCQTCSKGLHEGFGSNNALVHEESQLQQSALFAATDLCSAINTATGKTHLFVIAPSIKGTFTVTSYSSKV